jgi:hypothetical protein
MRGYQLAILPNDGPEVAPNGPYQDEQMALGQFPTPMWAAEQLLRQFFPDLATSDVVLEPSCGRGAWLHAVPATTSAIGIEIDISLAAQARAETGRRIIEGDFRSVPIDVAPTIVVGNPPFGNQIVAEFLSRAHGLLPEGGRAGFLLPAHTFSSQRYVLELHRKWSIEQHMIPRYIYPRLRLPLVFAVLRKEQQRRLVGFALYHEFAAVREMPKDYQAILERSTRPPWRIIVEDALRRLGGQGSLDEICQLVEPRRPAESRTWRDTIRRVCGEFCDRVRPGYFQLPATPATAA